MTLSNACYFNFNLSGILRLLNASLTRESYHTVANAILRRYLLCVLRTGKCSPRNFRLDKRFRSKVKVSVRNYIAIRRSLIKKHQAVDFRRDAENVLTAAPHPREDRMSSSMNSRVLLVFVIALALSVLSFAQKDTGSIVGTVKDQTGALVANAKVTVTDVERGPALTTTTNDAGEYVAGPLRVGRYTVTVQHPGFKQAVSVPVNLDVQQRIAINVTLQVGQISEAVEVTGAAPLLETETSELGQVVDHKRVANLPLNGRNFAQLALLTAGTAPSEPGARDEGGYGFSANGARSLQNNFLLDGVDNNSNLPDLLNETNYVIQPSVEALEEFKVQTNAYSAEFGRGNGAIINATIKSGTNQFHGSVYEFLRNEKLDGKNFFDDPTLPIAPYKQNQFGFTFGGPIARNRTFSLLITKD